MSDNKNKEPTPKKLRDAAERGDIPKSQSFTMGMAMLVWWLLAPAASAVILRFVASLIRAMTSLAVMQDEQAGRRFYLEMIGLGLALPCMIGLLLAIALGMMQSKGSMASKRAVFDLKRINPAGALKQFFGLQKLASVGMSFLKMTLIGAVAFQVGRGLVAELYGLPDGHRDWPSIVQAALNAGWKASAFVVFGCVALGVCDLLIQHQLWKRRNKMSEDEVKREYKEQEGSPAVKGERRRLHRELTS